MPGSLRGRLVLLGIVLAVVAIVVTAFSVQRLTESDIRTDIERDLDAEIEIRDSLAFFGVGREDWDGIEDEVVDLAVAFDERIAVATLDGTILADSEQLLFGNTASLPSSATIVDPGSTLIEFGIPDEELFEIEAQNALFFMCFDAVGIEPIFTTDSFGIDSVIPSRELTEGEAVQFLECLNDPGFAEASFGELFVSDLDSAAPPVQLFIGFGEDRDSSLFSSGLSSAFIFAVLGILGAAIAITVLVAGRISRPIASLTHAAHRMTEGDLSTRVETDGSDELAQLGSAFNDMAQSLEAQDLARKTLTTDVAHELRSPLSNLRGYLEGIQDGIVEADPATIESLHDETTLLQGLVEDLQELSLAQAGSLTIHPAPTDLGVLVDRSVAESSRSCGAGGCASDRPPRHTTSWRTWTQTGCARCSRT